ncbi:MAG: RsmB/NOP family class I SAM-dependent RNA methyltransferase [Alphaproteobacteria bacterium]
MNLGARIQAAVELLDRIETPPRGDEALPADAVLNAYFRGRRYIGAKDRRAIGDAVFQTLRQRGMIDWHLVHQAGLAATNRFRALWTFAVHGGVATEELAASCDGARHHPAALSDDEARRVLMIDANQEVAPDVADQASYPAWLAPEIERQFGADAWAQMIAFTQPAPVDLRVNPLKATRDEALAALAKAGIAAGPTPLSPLGVRLEGRANVACLAAYREGLVEVQDESSQLASLLVGAKPGMRVLDLCAGGGGKSLALAAAMGNRGSILACDTDARRLARLAPRLARSGARIVKTQALGKGIGTDTLGQFDRVLVDAPCSGSGTWRRHPDAKWRLTPAMLDRYRAAQAALLREAARHVRPNGRLVYAVCSILPSEGADQVAVFLSANKGWRPIAADRAWREAFGGKAPFEGAHMLLTPHRHRTDGFFAAVLAPP